MKRLIILISCLIAPTILYAERIVVLNAGEGLAVLIKSSEEGMLIDTGHPGMSFHILDRLKFHGITKLTHIILTHLHPDHAGGYFRLKEAFPEAVVLHNGHPLPENIEPDMVRWVREALNEEKYQKRVKAGDQLEWNRYRLTFLWPIEITGNNLNRHSLVIRIQYENISILVMGDADRVVERYISKNLYLQPVDLLVAGHHGASDTGDEEFLKAVSPRYAVISVNKNNIRGYPAPSTVETLSRLSQTLLRTDRDDEICFSLSNVNKSPEVQCRSLGLQNQLER